MQKHLREHAVIDMINGAVVSFTISKMNTECGVKHLTVVSLRCLFLAVQARSTEMSLIWPYLNYRRTTV